MHRHVLFKKVHRCSIKPPPVRSTYVLRAWLVQCSSRFFKKTVNSIIYMLPQGVKTQLRPQPVNLGRTGPLSSEPSSRNAVVDRPTLYPKSLYVLRCGTQNQEAKPYDSALILWLQAQMSSSLFRIISPKCISGNQNNTQITRQKFDDDAGFSFLDSVTPRPPKKNMVEVYNFVHHVERFRSGGISKCKLKVHFYFYLHVWYQSVILLFSSPVAHNATVTTFNRYQIENPATLMC
jgi:hypothetical protein